MGCRFDYREPWRSILALYGLSAFGLGVGLYQFRFGYPDAPRLAGPVAGSAMVGLGALFGGLAIWTTLDRLRRRRKVELSPTGLTLPRSRWSASSVTVPLEEITRVRTSRAPGGRLIHVDSLPGRYVVRSSMLPRPDDFDRLAKRLGERLEGVFVGEGASGESRGQPRFRPQFSLAGLFLFVTLVAVILGSHGYVYGGYAWDTLLDVAFALVVLCGGLWLAWASRWPARAFSLGFVVGYFLEVLAVYGWNLLDWVRFVPGAATPENRYPLTFAVRRLAEELPDVVRWFVETQAILLGGIVSGLACGCTALLIGCIAAHARRRAGGREGGVGRRELGVGTSGLKAENVE